MKAKEDNRLATHRQVRQGVGAGSLSLRAKNTTSMLTKSPAHSSLGGMGCRFASTPCC